MPAIWRAQEKQSHRLPCSIGIASSKVVAKIANSIGKHSWRRSYSMGIRPVLGGPCEQKKRAQSCFTAY